MKNLSTWLLVFFMIMFWGFRVVITVASQLAIDMGGMTPLNTNLEIILLFAVLVCIVLVIKRKLIGGLIYLLLYGMYFGVNLFQTMNAILTARTQVVSGNYINTFVSFIGMIIPVAVLLDLLVDKSRKLNPKDKKTDWFYANEDYDRKLDERADKNNYRTM